MQKVTVQVLGGGLTVEVDGRPAAVRGVGARSLLALLALADGRPVPLAGLAERLWGEVQPSDVRARLYTAITRLRRALGPGVIVTHGSSYSLVGRPLVVDAVELTRQVQQAGRDDPQAERAQLAEAVALWRAEPFADGFCEWLTRYETPRLVELHLAAIERLSDLDVAAGRPVDLLPELSALVDRYPLRESLAHRLLRALATAGRPAEALERYEAVRRHLADELGVDPGSELQNQHAQLLSAVDRTAPAPTSTEAGLPAAEAELPTPPRQLPSDLVRFTGRADVLAELDALADVCPNGPIRLVVLHGEPGVGKTSAAVHWAHLHRDEFPDGQFFVPLAGYGPLEPTDPATLLGELLRVWGVDGPQLPAGTQARSALWRSLVAGKRLLLVLDDARDAAQVRPLLPGSGALVLVTSRTRLGGLAVTAGGQHVPVSELSTDESRALLSAAWPGVTDADAPVLDRIADHCGHLPLALALAAEHGLRRPGTGPLDVLAQLDASRNRLDELSHGEDTDTDLRAVFSWSYRALDPDSARVLRLLSLHPGRDLDPDSVTALIDMPVGAAAPALERLADRHLLRKQGCRFVLHDLLREYAREQAERCEPPEQLAAAERRLLAWYCASASAADATLDVSERLLRVEPATAGPRLVFPDDIAALRWLAQEHATLVASIRWGRERGYHHLAVQLSGRLWNYLDICWALDESLQVHAEALVAARQAGDPMLLAVATNQLGTTNGRLGRLEEAAPLLEEALRCFEEAGESKGVGMVLSNLGLLHRLRGRPAESIECLERAIALARGREDHSAVGVALNNLAITLLEGGRPAAAARAAAEAVALHERLGERRSLAYASQTLGRAHLGRRDPAAACAAFADAVAHNDALGNRTALVGALTWLGTAQIAAGSPAEASASWRWAHEVLDNAGEALDPHLLEELQRAERAAAAPPAENGRTLQDVRSSPRP